MQKERSASEPEIQVKAISQRIWVDIRQGIAHVEFIMDEKALEILKAKLANVSHKHN